MQVQCSGQHQAQAEQIWLLKKNHHGHASLQPFSHDLRQELEVVNQYLILKKMSQVVYDVQWEEGA